MNFVYILIYLALITHTIRISVVDNLIGFFYSYHVSCLKLAPDHVRSIDYLHALVCGKNFSSAAQSQHLIASGLIHLFVVSGSHLQILQKLLQIPLKKLCNKLPSLVFYLETTILALLFIYSAVCKFNPPIFRCFLAVFFIFSSQKLGLRWRTQTLVLISGLFCLVLAPEWATSLSLQMSWIAALTLIIISHFFENKNLIYKNSIFYIQYICTFSFIGFPPLVSIAIATLFTPFLEFVLFPLAFSVYAFPVLSSLFDVLIHSLNFTLVNLNLAVNLRDYDSEQVIFLNWVLICALHAFLQTNRKAKYE